MLAASLPAQMVSLSDPAGDAMPVDSQIPADLTAGTLTISGGTVTFNAQFVPGTLSPPNIFLALFIDTDQDQATGDDLQGAEWSVFIFGAANPAKVARWSEAQQGFVEESQASASFGTNDATLSFSLAAIEDEGAFDFRVVAGVLISTTEAPHTDYMPDFGFPPARTGSPPPPMTPQILSFTATPQTVAPNQPSRLEWSTAHTTSVMIDQGIGSVSLTGFVDISPAVTTTYTLTASGPGGTVTAQVTVSVMDARTAPIISFSASPRSIARDQSATLIWSSSGTEPIVVTIDQGIGGPLPPSGSLPVKPEQTTTYTLTATNAIGSSSAQVTVEVVGEPVLFITTPKGLTQLVGTGGGTDALVVTNIGGAVASVVIAPPDFVTVNPDRFSLAPRASQEVTITGLPRSAGTFSGAFSIAGSAIGPISVPIGMLSSGPPAGPVAPTATVPRVDVSSSGSAPTEGQVTFRNDGSATLQAMAVADVNWVTPESGLITIGPGQTRAVSFTIDPAKQTVAQGSETAEISLIYIGGGPGQQSNGTTAQSTSVSLVYTRTPGVSGGGVPVLGPGELAWFVPGLVRNASLVSDFLALHRPTGRAPANLTLYHLGASTASALARIATLPSVAPSALVAFGDILKTVFNDPAQLASVQLRSTRSPDLAVNASIFNVSRAQGLYGSTIVSYRSDRGAAPNERIVLPGVRSDASTTTSLFLQEVAGVATSARTDFLDESGRVISSRTDNLDPFTLREANNAVPQGAVAAVVTNFGPGRMVARGLMMDVGGDVTDVVDWTARNAISESEPQFITFAAKGQNDLGVTTTELVLTNRGQQILSGTLSAVSSTPARRRAVRRGSTSPPPQATSHLAVTDGVAKLMGPAPRIPQAANASMEITIGPLQSRTIPDVLGALGVASGSVSYVLFTPASASASITALTRTVKAGAPTLFTALPVIGMNAALKNADSKEFGGVESASQSSVLKRRAASFQSALGLIETTGKEVTVRATLQFTQAVSSGLVSVRGVASRDYTLAPRQFLRIADLARDIIGPERDRFDDLRNMQLDIVVVGGEGRVVPIVAATENGSGDTILRLD